MHERMLKTLSTFLSTLNIFYQLESINFKFYLSIIICYLIRLSRFLILICLSFFLSVTRFSLKSINLHFCTGIGRFYLSGEFCFDYFLKEYCKDLEFLIWQLFLNIKVKCQLISNLAQQFASIFFKCFQTSAKKNYLNNPKKQAMFQQQHFKQNAGNCPKASSRQLFAQSIRKQTRKSIIKDLRNIEQMQPLPWQKSKSAKFTQLVQQCSNPFSLIITILQIADQLNWRAKKSYIQILIKRFHHICQREPQIFRGLNQIVNFQRRFSQVLYLGDQSLQQHLKLLLTLMLSLNKKYGVLDEQALSLDILSMQKYVNVYWMLTQCQTSRETISKICRSRIQSSNILPVITIVANFIESCSQQDAELLIQSQQIQNLIHRGIFNEVYEVSRETLLLINNLMGKNWKCFHFIMSKQQLIKQIRTLNNQELRFFQAIIQARSKQRRQL